VFKFLREQGVGAAEVATQLNITQHELSRHVFGLLPLAVDGGHQGGGAPLGKPPLRMIAGGQHPTSKR